MKINKPEFWDNKKPNLISKILYFFSYPVIFFSRLNHSKIKIKEIKTICVGNIYLGGTGKTPTSIAIYDILKNLGYRTVFIKKFYKNQYDEQKILKKRGSLICNKNRLNAITHAKSNKFDFAICDDGLQDQNIDYDLKIVCFNFDTFVGNGLVIPAGPLREKIEQINKYDVAIVNGNGENISSLKKYLLKFNKNLKVFKGIYVLNQDIKRFKNKKFIAFSGIGNHKTFLKTLKKNKIKVSKNIKFPDHYKYRNEDIFKIKEMAKKYNYKLITTEKDFLRMSKTNKKGINFLKINIKINDSVSFSKIFKKI
tara:strand:+ start:1444 stop:2373 length:930 start_codon:yes stop_codon:yes gene_type:complete